MRNTPFRNVYTQNEKLRIGQAGEYLVQEQFTWAEIAADMIEAYQWMLGGSAPPSVIEFQ